MGPSCKAPSSRRGWSDLARPPGFIGWLATVDHKEIGRRYIVTALIFLALGGVLALADAAATRAARQRPDQRRALQRALHHARLDDDVPVRRAGDGRRRDLHRSR